MIQHEQKKLQRIQRTLKKFEHEQFMVIMKVTKSIIMVRDMFRYQALFNPLNAELNPICHLLALLRAHHILHVSRIRVKMQSNI
jgi:hypothetical protein